MTRRYSPHPNPRPPRGTPPRRARHGTQRGISLLELLVGIVVSMLTVLAITQAFLEAERQRRAPAAGADAQTNGILALDAIQRDVRQAGYGLGGGPWVGGCTTGTRTDAATVGLSDLRLRPIVIEAGTPSDSIEILTSGKIDAAMQIKLAEDYDKDTASMVVAESMGIEKDDWLIIASKNGGECDAFKVSTVSTAAPWKLTHGGDALDTAYLGTSILNNMGAQPIRRRWSVSSAYNLQITDLATGTGTGTGTAEDAYPEVVVMRACYFRDSGGTKTCDTTVPTSRAEWSDVIGIRLALVVRSPQWNQDTVTASAPQWNRGTTASPQLTLSLTHLGADWDRYRYRLYETLIPLRNLLWNANAS